MAQESELHGYPVHAAVAPRGRAVALTGLVPTPEAGTRAFARLRAALPAAAVTNETNSLPGGLPEAQADIKALQAALSQLTAESARSNAALRQGLDALQAELKRSDVDGLRGGLKELGAKVAQADAATQAALTQAETVLRGEIARAVAPTPRAKLEHWSREHAIFFNKDTDYREPQTAAAALDELARLLKETDAYVRVVGYTDEKGGLERNTPLSQARADKILAELIGRGVASARLVAVGRNDVADLSPAVGDGSPNRRVEFEIAFEGEAAR